MRLRDIFYLNKSDRQVLLMLLSLAAIALCAIYFLGSPEAVVSGNTAYEDNDSNRLHPAKSGDASRTEHREDDQKNYYYAQQERTVERFPFDPNTADSSQLLRLGLQPWQVRNIYKYRAAGGIYRTKKDFAKLYGLTVKEYRELEPYIQISPDYLPASTLFDDSDNRRDGKENAASDGDEDQRLRYPVKLNDGETIDLNMSDTTSLKTVPGIGSYFARRIVEYGRRLGGYVSVSQLDEIEDFPTGAKAYFVVSQPHPHQVAINHLTLNELKKHPYINFYMARAITDYRRLRGNISSLEQLRLLPEFPPEVIGRLAPYVTYD